MQTNPIHGIGIKGLDANRAAESQAEQHAAQLRTHASRLEC